MTCREFVDFLMAYIDEELPRDSRSVFEQHMEDCPSCLTYLDTYRDTIRLGGLCVDDPEGPVPADVPEPLVAAILAARSNERGRS